MNLLKYENFMRKMDLICCNKTNKNKSYEKTYNAK